MLCHVMVCYTKVYSVVYILDCRLIDIVYILLYINICDDTSTK